MKRELVPTGTFLRAIKRLSKKDSVAAGRVRDTLTRLADDAFEATLKTHPLKADLAGRFACSVAFDLRIIFRFVEEEQAEKILLLSLGTHEDVY